MGSSLGGHRAPRQVEPGQAPSPWLLAVLAVLTVVANRIADAGCLSVPLCPGCVAVFEFCTALIMHHQLGRLVGCALPLRCWLSAASSASKAAVLRRAAHCRACRRPAPLRGWVGRSGRRGGGRGGGLGAGACWAGYIAVYPVLASRAGSRKALALATRVRRPASPRSGSRAITAACSRGIRCCWGSPSRCCATCSAAPSRVMRSGAFREACSAS